MAPKRAKKLSVKMQHEFLDYAKDWNAAKCRELIEADAAYVNCQPCGHCFVYVCIRCEAVSIPQGAGLHSISLPKQAM